MTQDQDRTVLRRKDGCLHETAAAGPWGVADGWAIAPTGMMASSAVGVNACVRTGCSHPHTASSAGRQWAWATLSSAIGTAMPADQWGTMRGDKYCEVLCAE